MLHDGETVAAHYSNETGQSRGRALRSGGGRCCGHDSFARWRRHHAHACPRASNCTRFLVQKHVFVCALLSSVASDIIA
jgi:hypothetical protein